MQSLYLKLPSLKPVSLAVLGKEINQWNARAYLVGGPVRDILLKRPIKDIDILVDGSVEFIGKKIAQKFKGKMVYHPAFMTACIVLPGERHIDLAAFRKETYAFPGALPQTQGGVLKDDLSRRDFSINTLVSSLNADDFGRLIDQHGGYADLRERKVRVLHDQSFIDDPTRIIRAIRFEQRLGFTLEKETKRLLIAAISKELLTQVKGPRLFAEFRRALGEYDVVPCLKRMSSLGILAHFGLENKDLQWSALKMVESNKKEVMGKPPYEAYNNWAVHYLAVLLEKMSAARQTRLIVQFNLTKQERQLVQRFPTVAQARKFLNKRGLPARNIYKMLSNLRLIEVIHLRLKYDWRKYKMLFDRYWNLSPQFQLKINGNDLKKMGVQSGELMGRVLQQLRLEKLDKGLKTKIDEKRAASRIIASEKRGALG